MNRSIYQKDTERHSGMTGRTHLTCKSEIGMVLMKNVPNNIEAPGQIDTLLRTKTASTKQANEKHVCVPDLTHT